MCRSSHAEQFGVVELGLVGEHVATRQYIDRRVAEGKTHREATRLLKRYLARHLYRVMQNATPLTT